MISVRIKTKNTQAQRPQQQSAKKSILTSVIRHEIRHLDLAADDVRLGSFHLFLHVGDVDYRPYFAEIEPIFWKYEGRPHWGKVHTLDARRLSALYPRHWQDFQEVRAALDPQGRLLNAHLKQIFLS